MAPLSIQTYVVGPVQTNCYFAINDDTKEVLIIDPGASAKQLAEKVKEQGLKPVAILLTHGHFDHATGAGDLAQLLHIKIYAQEKEKETLENPQLNLSGWQGSELVFYADEYLKDEQEIDLAGFHIREEAAAIISHIRTRYSAETVSSRLLLEGQISRREVHPS